MFKLQEESGITREYEDPEELYDFIFALTGDEYEAIEVSSWAELAVIGNQYLGDGFTVTVEEE